jgi:uncharacterized protein YecT (DUF1311 family)
MTTNAGFVFGLLLFTLLGLTPQDVKKQTTSKEPKDLCDSAMTQLDMNQCYGDQYSKSDAHLNVLYQKVIQLLEEDMRSSVHQQDEDQRKHSEMAIQKLKATEKAWIAYRDLQCDAARFEYEGGSMNPMIWAICMTAVTEHRISDLKDAYETPDRKLE